MKEWKLVLHSRIFWDLGLRLGAATVVLVIFFGLGYVKRSNLLGLAGFFESQLAFFTIAFFLVGVAAVSWILYQQSKA